MIIMIRNDHGKQILTESHLEHAVDFFWGGFHSLEKKKFLQMWIASNSSLLWRNAKGLLSRRLCINGAGFTGSRSPLRPVHYLRFLYWIFPSLLTRGILYIWNRKYEFRALHQEQYTWRIAWSIAVIPDQLTWPQPYSDNREFKIYDATVCVCSWNIHNLWRCRCHSVEDLKLPNILLKDWRTWRKWIQKRK